MPVFVYNAKDTEGNYHKGEVDTADSFQAARLLRRKRLIVISIKPKNEASATFLDQIINRISFNDIVMMTRQLATMIEAGLVLSEALDILEEQQTNKRFQKVLTAVSHDIKGGLDFATALEKHPDVFPPLYSRLIKAGQASGKLDVILKELATNLEKEREFRSKLQGTMIYPVVVLTMMVGVMGIMVFFVMPKLMGLYKESNLDLPLPTKIMLGTTSFLLNFWWAILFVLIVSVLAFKHYISTPQGRLMLDEAILRMPVVGRITKMIIMTNFTRTFALLVTSGLSILEAIKIVSDVAGNKIYQAALNTTYQGVERGLTFSGQLLGLPIFPKIVGQMAKTGEETGKLDEIMFKLAEFFESETDHSLKNVTTLIEPIVLVILGVGVAFLVISVILPIYQLTTNVR